MTGEGPTGSRFWWGLAAAAGAGLVVRVGYVLLVAPDALGFDAIWYELQSETLARGHGYVDPDLFFRLGQAVPTANFPPLWPLVLALASRLGADGETVHRLVGALLGTGTVVLTGLLGRRVATPLVGWVGAGLVAVSPLLVATDGSLMAESLYVLLVTASVLVAYRAIGDGSWWWFAVLGLLLGLAALARSDALLLAPLLIGAAAWRRPAPGARRVALGVLAASTVALTLAPWAARNQREMGEPVWLSSNSGSVLEGANCPSTYAGPLLGAWDAACLAQTRSPLYADELSWASAGRQAGIDHARDNLSRLPVVGTARVLRAWSLWDPVDQAELEDVETRRRGWQVLAGVVAVAMLGLAAAGTPRLVLGPVTVAPLVAVVVGVTLAALAANGNTRFTLAAQPVVAVAAAAFLVRQPSWEPTMETNETISPG